jgi:hypothetical protein
MDYVVIDKLNCSNLINLILKETGAEIFHILPHVQLTLNTLPWKRNRLLLCRLLLVTEC